MHCVLISSYGEVDTDGPLPCAPMLIVLVLSVWE